MSDVLALAPLLVGLGIAGFAIGFLAVKANYAFIVFFGRVFTSGTAGLRYAAAGILATVLLMLALEILVPDLTPMGLGVQGVLFLASFGIGVLSAEERFDDEEVRRISAALLDATFPASADAPSASETSAVDTSLRILATMPESAQAAIRLLYATFDSRTFVLLVTVRHGRLRWRRFVSLPPGERRRYLEDWQTDPRLAYGAHAFRILSSNAYYLKGATRTRTRYDGELLRASYLE